jgi:hypothetical protein
MRRCNDALYFTDEIVRKLGEGRSLSIWDFTNILFPRGTNRKQFDCAFRFLLELEKRGEIGNTQARGLFESSNYKIVLMAHVLPKLKKFGFVESNSGVGARRYRVCFSKGFADALLKVGFSWMLHYSLNLTARGGSGISGDGIEDIMVRGGVD